MSEVLMCVQKEENALYNAFFAPENEALSAENAFFWDDSLIVAGIRSVDGRKNGEN